MALSLSAQLAARNGYRNTATTVGTTLGIAQAALTGINSNANTLVQQSLEQPGAFTLDNSGQTSTQQAAASELDQIVSLLNTQVGNNYIFSGSATNQPSVASANLILNGNGAQAGLKQLISQRQQADLGVVGNIGRLGLATAASTVTGLRGSVDGLAIRVPARQRELEPRRGVVRPTTAASSVFGH